MTTRTAHTPGPWRLRGYKPKTSNFDPYYYRIVERWVGSPEPPGLLDKYEVLAKVQAKDSKQIDELAYLIAAAPELLEALKFAVEACKQQQRIGNQAPMIFNAIQDGELAIAKAEGRSL